MQFGAVSGIAVTINSGEFGAKLCQDFVRVLAETWYGAGHLGDAVQVEWRPQYPHRATRGVGGCPAATRLVLRVVHLVGSPGGIAPPGSHRTEREPLGSLRSSHRNPASSRVQAQ